MFAWKFMKGIMTYFWGRLSCHNSSFSFKMIALIGNTAAHRSTCSSQFSNGVLIFTFLIIKAIQHMSEGSSLLNYINTLWRLDCSWAWTGSVESSNCVWELVSTMCWAQGFTIVWTISSGCMRACTVTARNMRNIHQSATLSSSKQQTVIL